MRTHMVKNTNTSDLQKWKQEDVCSLTLVDNLPPFIQYNSISIDMKDINIISKLMAK